MITSQVIHSCQLVYCSSIVRSVIHDKDRLPQLKYLKANVVVEASYVNRALIVKIVRSKGRSDSLTKDPELDRSIFE